MVVARQQQRITLSIVAVSVALYALPQFIVSVPAAVQHLHLANPAVLSHVLGLTLAALFALSALLLQAGLKMRSNNSETAKAQDIARHLSYHDQLTGLPNRRYLFEHLDQLIAADTDQSLAPALVLLNLDRFNPVNDLRGHQAGDFILQQVARRITTCCAADQCALRFGGDEFAILLQEPKGGGSAAKLVQRIVAALETGFEFPGGSTRISCSMGVAVWKPGDTSAVLVKNASQAMHQSKAEGRARTSFFNEGLGEQLRIQAQYENDLAIAIDAGEIQPYFQPIICLADGKLLGFEVLARWISPKHGLVPPDRFIPLAEETGLMGVLTWQLLRRSCRILAGWDPDLSIAFNISPHQFSDPDFARKIGRILDEAGIDGSRLEIEITENAVIKDIQNAKQVFTLLHRLGVRISLDDFGTGYSSLATLNQLPFDKLKIDRSFVSGVTKKPQSAKIVQGILSLAASLDLVVTAEGIENTGELGFLVSLDCDQGQGYLFSKPLPQGEAETLLNTNWKGGVLPLGIDQGNADWGRLSRSIRS